jgi:DNA-directed RNA polymerase subunit RPC12/RpoP
MPQCQTCGHELTARERDISDETICAPCASRFVVERPKSDAPLLIAIAVVIFALIVAQLA